MEKFKKSKIISLLKRILLIIVIAILIYASIVLYRFYVIHKVINGIKNYHEYNNYYYKATVTLNDDRRVSECWNDNGTALAKISTVSTMIWTDKNGGYIYNVAQKTAVHFNSDNLFAKVPVSLMELNSVVYSINDVKIELLFAFLPNTSVRVEKYNNIKYYVIKAGNSEELWINKENLFPLKNICFNGGTYEYEFTPNITTVDDVAMPDLTGYTIKEINH